MNWFSKWFRRSTKAYSNVAEMSPKDAAADAALRKTTDELIVDLNQNSSEVIRAAAATELGNRKSTSAVEHLVAALRDPERVVHRLAARALGQLGEASGVDPLIDYIMQAEDKGDVECAGKALRAFENPNAKACVNKYMLSLISNLKDQDYAIRERAAEALRWIGDSNAVPALIAVLTDEDKSLPYRVQWKAATALETIGDPRGLEEVRHKRLHGGDAWCYHPGCLFWDEYSCADGGHCTLRSDLHYQTCNVFPILAEKYR
jgi:HEAT repeat protein